MAAHTVTPGTYPTTTGPGFSWRVATSILSFFGLLSFILVYLAFWADQLTGFQSATVVIVAILIFIAVNAAAWASWGTRQGRPYG